MDEPRARLVEVNGELALIDPDAAAVARAVAKHNCGTTLEANRGRVEHFRRRVSERGDSPADVLVVLANVDDPNGAQLAAALMPGHDWQQYRDRGEVPFARGLAGREGIQGAVNIIDPEAGRKLAGIEGLAVVVVDHGTAECWAADSLPATTRCPAPRAPGPPGGAAAAARIRPTRGGIHP